MTGGGRAAELLIRAEGPAPEPEPGVVEEGAEDASAV